MAAPEIGAAIKSLLGALLLLGIVGQLTDQNGANPVVLHLLRLELQAVDLDHGAAAVLGDGAQAAEQHAAHRIIVLVLGQLHIQLLGQVLDTEGAAHPP